MIAPSVLFVDHTGALGGAELYLLDVVRHYPGSAHVVLFEDGPFADWLVESGVSVEVLEGRDSLLGVKRAGGLAGALRAIPNMLSLAKRVAQRARAHDVVFANSQKALIVASLASRLARRPLVWNLHDILTADHFSAFNRKVAVAFANGFAQRVIVNSEATLRAFHEAGGAVEKGTVVYNGVETAAFDEARADDVVSSRRELGLVDVPVVGVFSRLSPWKGQHVLIEALPQLPNVHALFVGSALFGEGGYEEKLYQLAERLGVSDRVHFLGFRSDIALLMKCCDVVAHTSVSPEPFGRVIIEAMAAGRPVVATKAGGALEIVTEETGLLIPPRDSAALAHAIRTVLNPDVGAWLATAARERVQTTFSQKETNAGIARVVDSVVNAEHLK